MDVRDFLNYLIIKFKSCGFFKAIAGNKAVIITKLFYLLLCSELMAKVSFSGSKISFVSRYELIISAGACCTLNLLRLFCREKL